MARTLRRRQTLPEKLLWLYLRNRRLDGIKFLRQHPIGRYIADFYCNEFKFVVELDGNIHDAPDRKEYDSYRTEDLDARGISVLRIRNDRITIENMDQVLNEIRLFIESRAKESAKDHLTEGLPKIKISLLCTKAN